MSLKTSRTLTALALLVAAFLAFSPPAWAGWTPLTLLSSGTVSATGQGGVIAVGGLKELVVYVSCTNSTGTGVLDVWLQSSNDGVTWYDLPYPLGVKTNTSATETAPTINKRNVLAGQAACSTAAYSEARYTIFGLYVRVSYVVTVTTTPTYTFAVNAIGKN